MGFMSPITPQPAASAPRSEVLGNIVKWIASKAEVNTKTVYRALAGLECRPSTMRRIQRAVNELTGGE